MPEDREHDGPYPRRRLRGVVAIDGPSGTGKSTVARGLAVLLGARYLDTGAMYRAVTLAALRRGVEPGDQDAVLAALAGADLTVSTDPAAQTVLLCGDDVTAEIRGAAVTGAVSAVSAVPGVRARLVAMQRARIVAAVRSGGIVVEGRDIGTVVSPDAPLKVFLTAADATRAQRRAAQDGADPGAVLADVRRRDTFDSTRAASPLRAAADVVEVDTTSLGVERVVARLAELAEQRGLVTTVAAAGVMSGSGAAHERPPGAR